jgi:hypothetical protein
MIQRYDQFTTETGNVWKIETAYFYFELYICMLKSSSHRKI